MKQYTIVVRGEPTPKARPRVVNGHAYTPKRTKDAEKEVAYAWLKEYGAKKISSPINIEIIFNMRPPQGKRTSHVQKRPDIDNLVKTILDGLNGVAYLDDKQVYRLTAIKRWADLFNGEPSTVVHIRTDE